MNESIFLETCKILKAIDPTLRSHSIQLDSGLRYDLGLDSLDLIDLGMELEETFDVEIPDYELNSWSTVEDVVRCVQSLTVS